MDPFSLMGLIGGGATALGGIKDIFSSHKTKSKSNPAYAATQELNKIPGQVLPYLNPYMQTGLNAIGGLSPYQQTGIESLGALRPHYNALLNNPNSIYNFLSSGYQQSPAYQAKLKAAMAGANNAYAMGGQLGTPQHERIAAQAAGDVASQDFDKYLTNMFRLYQGGLSGTEGLEKQGYGTTSDLAKLGYGAAGDYASLLANLGQQKGNLNYAGQAGLNQQNSQGWTNLTSGLGQMGSSYFGGPAIYDMYQKFLTGGQ